MNPIQATDTKSVALELEAWVRGVAYSLEYVGAVVFVVRMDGTGIFSVSSATPEASMAMGQALMKLGAGLVEDGKRQGVREGKKKPPRLVGIS